MARHDDLNKIAQEFIMIDDFYRRTCQPVRRSYGPPKTIDSHEAAKRYGGAVEIITGRRQQYQPSESVVHQVKPVAAAEEKMSFYEGRVSVMDYSKRKSGAVDFNQYC